MVFPFLASYSQIISMEQQLDRESMGTDVQHPFDPFGVLRVPLHDPKPLSPALKRKWDGHRGGHTEKLTSHDDIEAKLTLAEQKRQVGMGGLAHPCD